MEFVAPEIRREQIPCRFIELAPSGVSIDSLYRGGTQAESEEALRQWLHQRIRELEGQVKAAKQLELG
jgi:hypothetical protein